MTDLTCDDCGTINSEYRDDCKLCGESLREEEARREKRGLIFLLPAAVLLTGLVCILPGLLAEALFHTLAWGREFDSFRVFSYPLFWAIWLLGWAIVFVWAKDFKPPEHIETESRWGFGRRDGYLVEAALAYYMVGVIKVRNLWVEILGRLRADA